MVDVLNVGYSSNTVGGSSAVEGSNDNEEAFQRSYRRGLRRPLGADFWIVRELWNWLPPGTRRTHWLCASFRTHDVRRYAQLPQRRPRPSDRRRRRTK